MQEDADRTIYEVGLAYKLPPEERTVYREHADPQGFVELHSEPAEVGEPAYYAQGLTEAQYDAILDAEPENLAYIYPSPEARAFDRLGVPGRPPREAPAMFDTEEQALRWLGVERAALEFCGMIGGPGGSGGGVLVGVGDTGYGENPYLAARLEAIWTWFSDDGLDRDGHGEWCGSCAVPIDARYISGKVLGDDGSGSLSFTAAFIWRFARYCHERGVPGVISLSLGGEGFSQACEDAARGALEMGVLVICASGNDGWRHDISTPANLPSTIAVGAIDHHAPTAPMANFANRAEGMAEPNIWAPGVGVVGEGEGAWSGTSMATPFVARAETRAMGHSPDVPAAVHRRKLTGSAWGKASHNGAGVLDYPEAIERLNRYRSRRAAV